MELSDGMVTKQYQASHWLYTVKDAKKGTVGQRAPQKSILSIQDSGKSENESSLGCQPQTLTLEGGDSS